MSQCLSGFLYVCAYILVWLIVFESTVMILSPRLGPLRLFWSVSPSRAAFASQMQRSPSSCRVVWSVFAQPSVPASFSPCVESMGSPRRLPRSTALLCVGGKVGTTAHLPPFNLSLYCSWKSESHRSYHYLEIISLIDVLVQCENTREAVVFLLTAFFVPVCLSV